MIRKNKWRLILSSVLILLPTVLGFFARYVLPEKITVHWGLDGTPDGQMNSSLIFFILPVILLAVHWICMIISFIIDKNNEQNKKIMEITFWIIPAISILSCGIIFATALGYTANINSIVFVILALTFIIIGNYLPKTTRNRTMGIKIKWTLANDENWNATHRFCGKLYVATGFFCFLAMLLPKNAFVFAIVVIILLCTITPVLYSYLFYKKQIKDGKSSKEDYKKELQKTIGKKYYLISIVIAVVIAVAVSVLIFTGNIEVSLDESSLTVSASYWSDLTLNYDDIDSIEYREIAVDGERIGGFGSARLLLGNFQNDELGRYIRYTYTGDAPCVIISSKGNTVVIGLKDGQKLKSIYDNILSEISE